MGLRDRIAGVGDRLKDEVDKAQDRVRDEITEFVAGPDGSSSVEGFVLGLVRAARDDDDADDATHKEVHRAARKRRRRLGIASFAAGPFAAVAGEATDLYSETATVCDLLDLHRLELTHAQVGGHMLVLWGVTDDAAAACAALDGSGRPIAELLATQVNAEYQAADSVPAKIRVIWKNRDLMGDLRERASSGAFTRVLRAGSHAKDLIERAERQLGIHRLP
jgi:hypothetical protein